MIEINSAAPEFSLPALQRQDREAFALLVEQTSGQIYRLLLRMLNNEQDAEDALQETYIKAFQALPGFEGRSSLKTWLYRIAANEALMLLRKHKPEPQTLEIDKDDDEIDDPVEILDWCCAPESELLSQETRAKLTSAAQHLSDNLKAVFLLRDVEGLSGEETAMILGVSIDVVKTRLLRARLKLREELSEYFAEKMHNGKSHS
jgi:RNA polymerase sigma-70 factor (ECF subfamily)